jgi:hypothetical protein
MFVVSVVCLSGKGLFDGLITRPEESYRLCCVTVCDLETSRMRAKTRKWVVKASKRRRRKYINIKKEDIQSSEKRPVPKNQTFQCLHYRYHRLIFPPLRMQKMIINILHQI